MGSRTALDVALFEANRTNRSLAQELKVHETQVSRWRSGMHMPEPATREAIAEALGRAVGELWPDAKADPEPDKAAA
jgi:transcriptional regulator with XRE-family HTH domain